MLINVEKYWRINSRASFLVQEGHARPGYRKPSYSLPRTGNTGPLECGQTHFDRIEVESCYREVDKEKQGETRHNKSSNLLFKLCFLICYNIENVLGYVTTTIPLRQRTFRLSISTVVFVNAFPNKQTAKHDVQLMLP